MNEDNKTPAWVWIVGYLLLIAALGSVATAHESGSNTPTDDGCSSGVSTQGCFP